MNQSNDYGVLAISAVIVVELVVTPGLLGGGFYLLATKMDWSKPLQLWGSIGFASLGLVIAFYRIYLISNRFK